MYKSGTTRRTLAILLVVMLLVSPLSAMAVTSSGAPGGNGTLDGTENYSAVDAYEYDELTVDPGYDPEGAVADGYNLTLTVDGVETSIVAGETYGGNGEKVVLTVTEAIPDGYASSGGESGPGGSTEASGDDRSSFRTAVYVDDNGLDSDKSVEEAIIGGTADDTQANNVVLRSETDLASWEETFNGIFINVGESGSEPQGVTLDDYQNGAINFDYEIVDPDIEFNGPGGNDFIGFGSAIQVTGNSRVLLQGKLGASDISDAADIVKNDRDADLTATYDTNISNEGQVRTTLVVEETGVAVVDGAYTKAQDGEWIDGYIGSVNTSVMKGVPWMLGLVGNVRANNLLDNSTGLYVNSILESENWGVLSTDESVAVQVEVDNSVIRGTGESTYGAYAIGGANIDIKNSYMFVGTYAIISANGANESVIQDSEVYSNRAAVMYHSSNGSNVTFANSQVEVVREFALMRAGTSTEFNVVVEDGTTIDFTGTEENILVQLLDNDDILDGSTMQTTVDYVDPAFAYGNGANDLVTATAYYNSISAVDADHTSTATFDNVQVEGDIYNSAVETGADLEVTLTGGAELTGAIASSIGLHEKETLEAVWHDDGATGSDDWQLLAKLTNYAFPAKGNDITLTIEDGSTWTVTDTSYLVGLTIDEESDIVIPEGYTIYVDGQETTVDELKAAGTIEGDIQIATELYTFERTPYMEGYEDDTFRGEDEITRAEAATVIYRIYDVEDKTTDTTSQFDDVTESDWFYKYVVYAYEEGIVEGYPESDDFLPEISIERDEFVAMMVRALGYEPMTEDEIEEIGEVFVDVDTDHWGIGYIYRAYSEGWIEGYVDVVEALDADEDDEDDDDDEDDEDDDEDDEDEDEETETTFAPNVPISRSEVATIVNRAMDREVTAETISDDFVNPYTDVDEEEDWAFYQIMAASLGHTYLYSGGSQIWLSVTDATVE